MKKRKRGRNRTLGFWLALKSIVVTLAAVAPFALLHLVNRFYWLRASTVLALGMLVIMGSVVASPPPCSAASSTGWSPA